MDTRCVYCEVRIEFLYVFNWIYIYIYIYIYNSDTNKMYTDEIVLYTVPSYVFRSFTLTTLGR